MWLWPRPQPACKDDRAVRRHLLDWRHLSEHPSLDEPRIRAMQRRISTLIASSYKNWIVGLACAYVIAIAIVSASGLSLPTGGVFSNWYGLLVGVPVGWALAWLFVWRLNRVGPLVCGAALAEGLCPSCGYNLHGLPVEDDRCCVCPECGSAWLHGRILRSGVVPSVAPGRAFAQGFAATLRGGSSSTIPDARLTMVPMGHLSLASELKSTTDPRARARLLPLKRQIGRVGRWFRIPVALVFVVPALVVMVVLFFVRLPISNPATLGAWFSGPVTLIFGLSLLRADLAYPRLTVLRLMLDAKVCPSCAALLDGLAPEPDGCTVCARCRAAWRLPPA